MLLNSSVLNGEAQVLEDKVAETVQTNRRLQEELSQLREQNQQLQDDNFRLKFSEGREDALRRSSLSGEKRL